jgi:7-cyano-7-deazaguanine synthase
MNSKIVMALSGGMDSTTLLVKLLHEANQVECLHFNYGSKHGEYEWNSVREIAKFYGVKLIPIDLTGIMSNFESHLLKSGGEIPEGRFDDPIMEQTVVPGRNMIFLSIMAGYAWSIDASKIAIGIHKGDHAIYADCRTEFYKAMDTAIYLGTDKRVEIIAPFIDSDKTDILKYGIRHDVPYGITRTCYKDQSYSCGKCGSCVERLEAFKNCGYKDPLEYE